MEESGVEESSVEESSVEESSVEESSVEESSVKESSVEESTGVKYSRKRPQKLKIKQTNKNWGEKKTLQVRSAFSFTYFCWLVGLIRHKRSV